MFLAELGFPYEPGESVRMHADRVTDALWARGVVPHSLVGDVAFQVIAGKGDNPHSDEGKELIERLGALSPADREALLREYEVLVGQKEKPQRGHQGAKTLGEKVMNAGAESLSRGWVHDAKCIDEDPELFFPEGNSAPAIIQTMEAKKVCGGCAVRAECLAYALESDQGFGIWGGLSEDEHRALKRRNARNRLR